MAEIAAVLKGGSQHSPNAHAQRLDVGTGDHPLSQGLQETALLGQKLPSMSSDSLSGGSQVSVASSTDAQQYRRRELIGPKGQHLGQSKADEAEGRFARKLQEFQKGTDMLRHEICLG